MTDFWETFHDNFIFYSQRVFAWNPLNGSHWRNIFFIFSFLSLTWGVWTMALSTRLRRLALWTYGFLVFSLFLLVKRISVWVFLFSLQQIDDRVFVLLSYRIIAYKVIHITWTENFISCLSFPVCVDIIFSIAWWISSVRGTALKHCF